MAKSGLISWPSSTTILIYLTGISFSINFQLCISQSIPTAGADGLADNTSRQLEEIQSRINNATNPFCYQSHSKTKENFKKKEWKDFTGDSISTIVYPFCVATKELGNRLGNYFTELACAQVSGTHFVAVHKQFDDSGSRQGHINNATFAQSRPMLDLLPDTFVHPFPVSPQQAADNVESLCKCTRYCWSDPAAPWVNASAFVGSHMLKAITKYSETLHLDNAFTVNLDTDFSNAESSDQLPTVPDVTIQYRCGDNIGFSYIYGILPFAAITSRIPPDSKYIYVLSDHPSRAAHSPYSGRCHLILKSLFEFLKESNPKSVIVVKRGGDLYLDYVRMALSKVLICSASTFCLWPALANVQRGGQVHFPLTDLIAGADNIDLAPKTLGNNFHWINDSSIISDFRKLRPWTQILDVLTGKMIMPL